MTLDGFFNIKTASELDIELCKKNLVQRDTLYTRRKQHLITCHFLVLRRTRVISIHPEWCLLNRGLILSLRYTLCLLLKQVAYCISFVFYCSLALFFKWLLCSFYTVVFTYATIFPHSHLVIRLLPIIFLYPCLQIFKGHPTWRVVLTC